MGSRPGNDAPSASSRSGKRKAAPDPQTGRSDKSQQRRAQVHAARAVPAQPVEAALKDGELDLQAFVAAHEFEIRSLEQSMATSKASGTSRAFQQVPRGLRRRTASHNPKRVPKRLRARALREMNEDNTPTVESRRRTPRTTRAKIRAETAKKLGILAARKRKQKSKRGETAGAPTGESTQGVGKPERIPRPKIRRNTLNEPPTPPAKFRKRQLNKTWLPTHAWHAKRARMTPPKDPLWRFAVPLTPNEKIYRPVHRTQGHRGAVVWDMSYVSTIGLYGNPVGMERVLRRVGVSEDTCWNNKGRKWRAGTRSWSGTVSRGTRDGRRQMCPCTIFWNPVAPGHKQRDSPVKENRELFLRVHPAAFSEVFNELLRLAKMETPQLYIEDLRYEIGSIDITGPASTEALVSILTPYSSKTKPKTKHAELFQLLTGLGNPSALPDKALLGFNIQDPRLRYPPRRPIISEDEDEEMSLMETIATWPTEEGLQPYDIFDRGARHIASRLPSQKVISRRRRNIAPGAFLKPALSDPPIPIILLASRSTSAAPTQGTWTLLAPWACILPLWYSLIHCPLSSGGNPRFGGLNEIQQVSFERGAPWFPADFPATDAGIEWERERRRQRVKTWTRRPRSKRVEWKSLDLGAGRKGEVGQGLTSDYEYLFKLARDSNVPGDDAMDVDGQDSNSDPQSDPLHSLSRIDAGSFRQLVSSPSSAPRPPPNALLSVRIYLLSRGVVGPCARIYRLPPTPAGITTSSDTEVPSSIPPEELSSTLGPHLPRDLRSQWLSRVPKPSTNSSRHQGPTTSLTKSTDPEIRKAILAKQLMAAPGPLHPGKPNLTDIGGHPLVPDAGDLTGFVTTGSYCLGEGRGLAIGSVAVEKVLPDVRENGKEGHLCIVRNAGENVGWIARWEAV